MEQKFWEGSIIGFGKTVGHISEIDGEEYVIDAYYEDMPRRRVVLRNFRISRKNKTLKALTYDEQNEFLKDLLKLGYGLTKYNGQLYKLPDYRVGTWVRIVGSKNTLGPITNVTDEFIKVSVLNKSSGIKPKYFDLTATEIAKLSAAERRAAITKLESYGFQWDEAALKPQAKRPRMWAGGTYWFITDRFTIRAAQDNLTPQHNQRYSAGNYFLSPQEANDVLKVILEAVVTPLQSPSQSQSDPEL